jgi:hypothetical protein
MNEIEQYEYHIVCRDGTWICTAQEDVIQGQAITPEMALIRCLYKVMLHD